MYLDALLADQPLTGRPGAEAGRRPSARPHDRRLPGGDHARDFWMSSIGSAFRLSLVDPGDHARQDRRHQAPDPIRRQWFAKRKSIAAILKEVMTNEASTLLDTDAAQQGARCRCGAAGARRRPCRRGLCTVTVTVWDDDPRHRRREAAPGREGDSGSRLHLHGGDRQCRRRPGWARCRDIVYANVRQPPVSTLNPRPYDPALRGLGGPARDEHLDAPPLFFGGDRRRDARSAFSLHVGDVGHTLVVGPTGAGQIRAAGADGVAVSALRAMHRSSLSTSAARSARPRSPWAAIGTDLGGALTRRC